MTKFKVGDKVQLTPDSIDYYEDPENGYRYRYIKPWEWQHLYGNLVIDKVYCRAPTFLVLYGVAEIDISFYEFELERD